MEHEKCLSCEHIPCADFHCKKDELEGGELYVLNECIKQKKVVPCQPITPLYSCCMLWQTAYKTLIAENKIEEGESIDEPLHELIWQCIYDLKASAFLALSAHYRSANQLLRPVVENILVGLYFKEKLQRASSKDEEDQVWTNFYNWAEDKHRISEDEWKRVTGKVEQERKRRLGFGFIIGFFNKEGVLTRKGIERFEVLQRKLNKYLHPYFQQMDIGGKKCSTCPATTRYDENRYYEWLDNFQNILDFIIEVILCDYPTIAEKEEAKEALGYLKSLESLGKELEIVMIKSKYLEDFIARLPDVDDLFGVRQ